VDHRVESIDIIGGVGHRALETIGIQNGVGSHHIAAIAGLHLALDVAGDAVMDAIGEVIPRGGLQLYLLQDWSSHCFDHWSSHWKRSSHRPDHWSRQGIGSGVDGSRWHQRLGENRSSLVVDSLGHWRGMVDGSWSLVGGIGWVVTRIGGRESSTTRSSDGQEGEDCQELQRIKVDKCMPSLKWAIKK